MLIFIQSIFLEKSIFLISGLRVSFHITADIQSSMLENPLTWQGTIEDAVGKACR